MALAKKKSTRDNIRKKVKDAIASENNHLVLLKIYNEAKSKTRYDSLIKDLHRKYLELSMPQPSISDTSVIDLRQCWIESTVRLKENLGSRMKKALLKKGYLQSMVDQLKLNNIGGDKFLDLASCKSVTLSSEYIILNFFDKYISGQQQVRIANVLASHNVKLPKHVFLLHAINGDYRKL